MALEAQPFAGALAAVDRILNREPEADEVLRQTVATLHERIGRYAYVAILLVEDGELALGPSAGEAAERARVLEVPIVYEGRPIGALRVAVDAASAFGAADREFLERVALLVSAHCLVGWDTGGVPWSEAS